MKYYVIAGEPSGDLHGGKLIREIAKEDTNATFRFCGGDLIYLGSPAEFEVKVGDNYKVVIAGKTLLNFDIK